MYQLSQSVREPPASVTVNTRLSDGISQRCLARPGFEQHAERLQQVIGRLVRAMGILDLLEDRKLAARSHVHFELTDAVLQVVIHALGGTARRARGTTASCLRGCCAGRETAA